jgi:hypothetical protein
VQELCRTLMRGYDAGWRSVDAGAKVRFVWTVVLRCSAAVAV